MLELGTGPPALPRPAATVILLRAAETQAGSDFEVYLLRRHAKSGFMGGAHVFPGGKLDDDDRSEAAWERTRGLSEEEASERLGEDLPFDQMRGLYYAAARETFEEAGVLLGSPCPHGALRRRANAGESLTALLREADLRLDLSDMWPFSRWITPEVERRRYDARFFLCRVEAEQLAEPDLHETTSGAWLRPDRALELSARAEIVLPPPTLRTLEQLAELGTADAAVAHARSTLPPRVAPIVELGSEGPIVVLPGDAAHPEAARAVPGSTRIALIDGRWVSRDADAP